MLVQCQYCGAPLDVKTGDRDAKCAYCERQQRVKGMHTLSLQTPPGWTPPQQWVPPPQMKIQVQAPLVYHLPASSRAAVAATAIWVPIIIAVTTLLPVGIGLVAALGGSGVLDGGLDPADPPTLGALAVGVAPVQRVFAGATEGSVSLPSGFGKYPNAPHVLLVVARRSLVQISTRSTDDTTLVLQLPTGAQRYDDDGGDGHDARLSVGLEPGSYPVWVGHRNEGVPFELTVSSLPVNELPGVDGLAFGGPPLVADVTLGPSADPMRWTARIDPTVATTHCGSHLSVLPQLLVRSAEPRMITLRAHGEFDATLVVRDSAGRYVCDDDSGDGNDPLVRAQIPAGAVAVWVGDRTSSSAHDVMLVLEPRPVGEQPPAPMIMPEARATGSSTDLDEVMRHTIRDFTVQGNARGYLEARSLDSSCQGYVDSAPTLSLRTTVRRRVVVRVTSRSDLVLASRSATGAISCNDDFQGRNPRLVLTLDPGEMDVWVGGLHENDNAAFSVNVAILP